ncbi:unnamed protein product [Owenia fusiformis]|uniref:Uncharacterized protein n=1 Tax=Owenia fusiformis TaxID=6347 RepID=A0A8J1TPQ3_OWEFU|nr:unnamed protein product [Owenia fusiformis]
MDIGYFTILLLSLVCLANGATKVEKPVVYTGPVQPLSNVSCYTCMVRLKNSMVYEGHRDCLYIDSNRTSIEAQPCLAGFCSIMRITQGDVMTVSRQCLPHCKVRDNTDLEGGYKTVVNCCTKHLCNSATSFKFGFLTTTFIVFCIKFL